MSWWDSFIFGMGARVGSFFGEVLMLIGFLVFFAISFAALGAWHRRLERRAKERRNAPTPSDWPGPL